MAPQGQSSILQSSRVMAAAAIGGNGLIQRRSRYWDTSEKIRLVQTCTSVITFTVHAKNASQQQQLKKKKKSNFALCSLQNQDGGGVFALILLHTLHYLRFLAPALPLFKI